jgi:hypothetical protein
MSTARQPDLLVALHIFHKLAQPLGTAGTADQAAMQADRHHLRLAGLAFGIERIEGIFQILEELLAIGEAGGDGETHVVGVERVGNDELRLDGVAMTVMVEPVGQVVIIGIGDVGEAAICAGKPNGIDGCAAKIKASRLSPVTSVCNLMASIRSARSSASLWSR